MVGGALQDVWVEHYKMFGWSIYRLRGLLAENLECQVIQMATPLLKNTKQKKGKHSYAFQGGQTWASTSGVPFSVVIDTQSVYHVMDGEASDVVIITSVKRREVGGGDGGRWGEVMAGGGGR